MVGMEIGNIAEWASIAWAVLSGIFMLISWYQSTGSKKARAEADDAVARAETQAKAAHAEAYEARRQTEAMQKLVESLQAQVHAAEASAAEAKRLAESTEKQAAQVEKIAESMRGPDLVLEHVNKARFALVNKTGEPITLESIENADGFLRLDVLVPGLVIGPYETVQFLATQSSARPYPSNLVLRVAGRSDLVKLPLIHRP